ncbi:MAG: 1-deoxy-D-xylulose-5-phosphate synthase [Actinomycetota bacterium]|nr:1-deoxy-D-xylulose-5-phosphate synthase [Actinomycetota bacterium]
MPLIDRITSPSAVRSLTPDQLEALAAEIRAFLVEKVSKHGGHLGPNLGVVELTLAIHRVFDSPADPIVFDTGHQAYVHKIVTGRANRFDDLRVRGGLSGYPSREESEHDWVENSHASTSLSYADGLAKAFAVKGESSRTPVAVIGDGAMTGGMAWEALNNIAAGKNRPLVIVFNDNGRSYAPTTGGMAERLAALRLKPGYERMLDSVKTTLPKAPLIGGPLYGMIHAIKSAMKDWLLPQSLFSDIGLKYVGPIDGHDVQALEKALRRAKGFRGPVLVHCVTNKGQGYPPALADAEELMHGPPAFDPKTGKPLSASGPSLGQVMGRELVRHAAERDDLVAITAAMAGTTGLGLFAKAYPDRFFDVGIAEQHAVTSAAGLALGGLHPVFAVYATFLNRAFDQLLMDCALHRLGITVVLDRSGITQEDGPSHHGIWDLSLAAIVPGLRVAAPRDEPSLVSEFAEALAIDNGPTMLRYPKGAVPQEVTTLRTVGSLDVLAEPAAGAERAATDVLLVSVGALAGAAVEAAGRLADHGIAVTVVDPRWVLPVSPDLVALAADFDHVVTVEDGGRAGGVGAAVRDALGPRADVLVIALPQEFLEPGSRGELLAEKGLTGQAVAIQIAGHVSDGGFDPTGVSGADVNDTNRSAVDSTGTVEA